MKKEVLSQFGQPDLILFGFLLFFFCFIGMIFWVYHRSRKDHYTKMSKLPLEISRNREQV